MTSPHRPAPRIFISHSHKDNDFGIQLVRDLRLRLGDDDAIWYDAAGGLSGGDAWWRKIMEELRTRPIFLAILSPDALASPWVTNEIDLAWYQRTALGNKVIIPLLYRECRVRDDLEMLQMISFLPPKSYEAGLGELLAALGVAARGPAASVPLASPVPSAPSVPSASNADTLVAADPAPLPAPPSEPAGSPPEGSMPTLLLLSILEAFPARVLPLTQRSVMIGRAASNDVVIADPAVSHEHLQLTAREATWQVSRLPSAGALYVNGRRCDDADLRPGDQIIIGTSILRFESPESTRQIDQSAIPRLAVDCPDYRCHFTVPLRDGALSIGRAPESGIAVPSSAVSTYHALLRRESDGNYAIEDTGSLNGITLHGARIQRERLRDGDVLIIGSRSQGRFVTLTYTRS